MHRTPDASTDLTTPGADPGVDSELIDAVVTASRVLVAVAARILAGLDEDITLPQYRALVVLAAHGTQRATDLSEALGVTPGTGSRMIERLARKQLVQRSRSQQDRRTVGVQITGAGQEIVRQVTMRRRAEIETILQAVPARQRTGLATSLRLFGAAAGELPEADWALGWDQ